MDTLLLAILLFVMILLFLGVLAVLFLLLRGSPGAAGLLSPLQSLTQAIGNLQGETKALSERVATMERGQAEGTEALRTGLSRAQESLAALQAHTRARQELEQRTAESIRRLEAVIAGTQTRGAAGENIIEVVFAQLPPEWQVRNFQVANKTVEFGLRLPNSLVLPIDSKWAATHLLEQFLACDEPASQQAYKAQIERAVLGKAREVRKYIDPSVTVGFAIAAVPDAVFDLCGGVQVEALQFNVVLVSYSMFVPYLLLVFQTILKTAHSIDLQKLNAHLDSVQGSIRALQGELEGRFSRAISMLGNSRDEMRVQLGRVSSGLTSLQLGAGAAPGLEPGEPQQAPGA
jgi:DNA recombination protein RmuC